jgi:methyl-accepting chemotaxis protein
MDVSIDGLINIKGALNAAVEAAWSGEPEKGLAVVAGELQKLAELAQKESMEVNAQFNAALKKGEDVGEAFAATGPAFQRAAKLMLEIREASAELRAGVEQINRAYVQYERLKRRSAALSRGDGKEGETKRK